MIAIWGCPKRAVTVAEVLAGDEFGSVCENDVVCCEAFFDGGCGGDDDDETSAETESEDWAVFLGERVESSVDWVFEEMKMAKDWESQRSGREILFCSVFCFLEQENGKQSQECN